MRAVVQRVTHAAVRVADAGGHAEPVGAIGHGLLVLVGVTHTDTPELAAALARKVHSLRVLRGELGLADDPSAAVLVVSQFTLYADTRKGRRPSWNNAAPGAVAAPLVEAVVDGLRALGTTVATGRFGADMRVELTNDGPVTVILDV